MNECFNYRFMETPNYDKLRYMLNEILLNINEQADNKLDWNEGYACDESALPQAAQVVNYL